MPRIMIRSLIALILCLPTFASAATTQSITAQWSKYTAPSGYTLAGYRLYQEGQLACQTSSSTATSLGCQVSMSTTSASFTLTAAFANGTESPHSSPFTFTAPSAPDVNSPPTAAFSVSATSGKAPLNVNFDASGSSDSDGTIAYYAWSFGDGTSATGKTTSRTYSTAGTFTATLTVTDNEGASNPTSQTITVLPDSPTSNVGIEAGEIAVSSSWVRVNFDSTFTSPIVVAGPPKFANSEPCVVRIRNVSKTGFDIQLAEWNYLDGNHPQETVNYLVLEKGTTTLPDGSIVEAGSFTGTTSFNTVKFNGAFAKSPVVLTTVASVNEGDTISGRIKNIGLTGFDYSFREQEKNRNIHANETINYVAWEPGQGKIGDLQFEAATTGKVVTNSWYTRTFQGTFSQAPVVLADMQSTNDTDTSALRINTASSTNFVVKVEEEKSLDTEVTHGAETVGYLAINSESLDEPSKTSFAVNFQPAGASTPNGFAVDSGSTFSTTRGYGWSTSPNSLGTRDRDSSLSPDQSYDTLIHVAPTGVWEMTVPNGTYSVTVVIGDPRAPDTINTVQAENVTIINKESLSSSKLWIERTSQVSVADGRLTLKFPGSSPYAKLCWVKIVSQ
jgi:PKD repeat protein